MFLLSLRRETRKKIRRNELVKEERVRERLCRLDTAIVASLHRLMVLWIPLSGFGRRFTTIGCSGKDGKSAQGDDGLPIRNDDASDVSIRVGAFLEDAGIHNIYCTLKLKCKF